MSPLARVIQSCVQCSRRGIFQRDPFEQAIALISIIYGAAYIFLPEASILLRELGNVPIDWVYVWGAVATLGGHLVLVGLHKPSVPLARAGFYMLAGSWLSLASAVLLVVGSGAVLVEIQALLTGIASMSRAQMFRKVEQVVRAAKEGRL